MQVTPIKTEPVTEKRDLLEFLENNLIGNQEHLQSSNKVNHNSPLFRGVPPLAAGGTLPLTRGLGGKDYEKDSHLHGNGKRCIIEEGSVLAITSKIVSILEGNVVAFDQDKDELIAREADYYLPRSSSKYNVLLTIKDGNMIGSAGIDESNSLNGYVLLPKDSQKTANLVREHFAKKFNLQKFGVIITDSSTPPLRWGSRGIALAHSGFAALNDYIGKTDIFGREFHYSRVSIMDGLAASAALTMGEGSECQPLAIISDVPFVNFQDRNPTQEELDALMIEPEDDLYAPLLNPAQWRKGRSGQ